jgi:hypothetical protein
MTVSNYKDTGNKTIKKANLILVECLECKELLIQRNSLINVLDTMVKEQQLALIDCENRHQYVIDYTKQQEDSILLLNKTLHNLTHTLHEKSRKLSHETAKKRMFKVTTIVAITYSLIITLF